MLQTVMKNTSFFLLLVSGSLQISAPLKVTWKPVKFNTECFCNPADNQTVSERGRRGGT